MDLQALTNTIEIITEPLFLKEQCGWFDGGCMTLASSVNRIYPKSVFHHVSRVHYLVDHVVIYFPDLDKYFDADGLQSKAELIQKMEEFENMENPRVFKMCESDFVQIEIFKDIEDLFIARHEQLLN